LLSKLGEGFPKEILTERLRLRPLTLCDAGNVRQLAGDRDVSDAALYIPYPLDYRTVEQWIQSHRAEQQNGSSLYLGIDLKTQNHLIGVISLIFSQEHERAEMGYWIGKDYQGSGYCSEAAEAVLEYGFKELNLNRIFSIYLKSNQASARVMEKIGMKFEGCMPKYFKKWEHFEDGCIYGILKQDYTGTKKDTARSREQTGL
jgi:RimJ/RimL family protein N-acetyltransferase